jgi:hypothetical protein
MEEETRKKISLLEAQSEKLMEFRKEGKIPSIAWATKMGIALGFLTASKRGYGERSPSHTIRVEDIDKAGIFTVLAGGDIAFYARGGLDILIKELEEGKTIFEIYKKFLLPM